MQKIGIICEYNPFHYGHKYHINEIKKKFPDSMIILVMSGPFTQRGDASVINKWDKTKIALNNNVDLVVELPFAFATQSADVFSHGAIEILKHLKLTGVNAVKEMKLTKSKIESFEENYRKLHTKKDKVILTYNPVYIILSPNK